MVVEVELELALKLSFQDLGGFDVEKIEGRNDFAVPCTEVKVACHKDFIGVC
jgi:hypothetical protein